MKDASLVLPHWIAFEDDWEKELLSREYHSDEIKWFNSLGLITE